MSQHGCAVYNRQTLKWPEVRERLRIDVALELQSKTHSFWILVSCPLGISDVRIYLSVPIMESNSIIKRFETTYQSEGI